MTAAEIDKCLEGRGIKPTANRILVYKALSEASRPLSLADLEERLDTLDKASIFRVVELFARQDVVCLIHDSSRSLKYELCPGDTPGHIDDHHVHFHCRECRRTFCLDEVSVPPVHAPEGFAVEGVNYMLTGLCPSCRSKGGEAAD